MIVDYGQNIDTEQLAAANDLLTKRNAELVKELGIVTASLELLELMNNKNVRALKAQSANPNVNRDAAVAALKLKGTIELMETQLKEFIYPC